MKPTEINELEIAGKSLNGIIDLHEDPDEDFLIEEDAAGTIEDKLKTLAIIKKTLKKKD